MQHPFVSLLSSINDPFYFGIGGIGDFLLLMSTFYDDVEDQVARVIFVPNSSKLPIADFFYLFPKIKKFHLWPRASFDLSKELWEAIEKAECRGTGVTPRNFEYVKDWIACGESTVFEYYGVKRNPDWAKALVVEHNRDLTEVTIQPYGGSDDSTKLKVIPHPEILKFLRRYIRVEGNIHRMPITVIIGLESELDLYLRASFAQKNYIGFETYSRISAIAESIKVIASCHRFFGCDSWGKTLAALCGKDVTIFPNRYVTPPEEMFGHFKDPSDYVFLDNWGFKIVE
jgi:hypothetical protein